MRRTLQASDWLEERLRRPVSILGAGMSGRAALSYIEACGGRGILFDEKAVNGAEAQFGEQQARQSSLVVVSPGFAEAHPWVKAAEAAGCELAQEFDLAIDQWRGPVVAVTGTNGKTTLTEFLEKAFLNYGLEAYAVGNIGRPLTALMAEGCNAEAIVVCEVSSFQAAHLRRLKPDFVLWTNFDEDHIDRHGTLQRYFDAKYNLIRLAKGKPVFYGPSVLEFASAHGYELDPQGLVEEDAAAAQALGLRGTAFENLPERSNYLLARALWLAMGLSEDELIEAANTFKKSPHRMELVCSLKGVLFWNDSKATNFHAALSGLKRFAEPVLWIGGGRDKGGNISGFVERLKKGVREAHVIGETGQALLECCKKEGIPCQWHSSMESAVAKAFESAKPGDNVLLSPGFASFDMFEGYGQRGEAFEKSIKLLEANHFEQT